MTDNIINLDEPTTQAAFGRLFGISQQAVAKLVEKGVLRMGDTLGQWIVQYAAHLREIAAGRGGEDQYDLTKAKARQAEADARLKELQYHERIHNLVDANWAAQQIANHATAARTEVENAVDHLVTGIESEHSISVNRDNINRALATAFRAIESYPDIVAAEVESSSQSGLE